MGFGVAFTTAPATNAIVSSVPLAKSGVGSAVNDTTREVGGALGIAVMGSLVTSAYQSTMHATVQPAAGRAGLGRQQLGGRGAGRRPRPAWAGRRRGWPRRRRRAYTDAMGTALMIGARRGPGGRRDGAGVLPRSRRCAAEVAPGDAPLPSAGPTPAPDPA